MIKRGRIYHVDCRRNPVLRILKKSLVRLMAHYPNDELAGLVSFNGDSGILLSEEYFERYVVNSDGLKEEGYMRFFRDVENRLEELAEKGVASQTMHQAGFQSRG